jgi:hypothetical protein
VSSNPSPPRPGFYSPRHRRGEGPREKVIESYPKKDGMSFLSGIGDLLKQYSDGAAAPSSAPGVEQHFDQVAQAVPSSALAGGLAEAFRSQPTAPFPQMAAELFTRGNSQQQAGVLGANQRSKISNRSTARPIIIQTSPMPATSPTRTRSRSANRSRCPYLPRCGRCLTVPVIKPLCRVCLRGDYGSELKPRY